jgi:hypothetical protein
MSISSDFRPFKTPMFLVAIAILIVCIAAIAAVIQIATS